MPEVHLPDEDAKNFVSWLGKNNVPLHSMSDGLVFEFPDGEVSVRPDYNYGPGATVEYPPELANELSNSGVIFENTKKPKIVSGGHRELVNN